MTETDWKTCSGPTPMLAHLRGKAGERKLRLFEAACRRRICHLLADEACRTAVEVIEEYADLITPREAPAVPARRRRHPRPGEKHTDQSALSQALRDARKVALDAATAGWASGDRAAGDAAWAVACASADVGSTAQLCLRAVVRASDPVYYRAEDPAAVEAVRARERQAQADLLRDVFGNPFRPFAWDPSWWRWNNGGLAKIALHIYEERRFEDMPVLGDALLDAGCTDEGILTHCQSGGPHVRGCWVLDLALGAE